MQALLPAEDASGPAARDDGPEVIGDGTDDEEDDERLRAALYALSADSPGAVPSEVGVLRAFSCCGR